MVETTKNLGGAPVGNDNAAKGARWRNAIDTALGNRCKSDGQKALVDLAEVMLKAAEEGEGWALKELGDRMDGKAPQAVTVGNENGEPFKTVNVVEVIPLTNDDSSTSDPK